MLFSRNRQLALVGLQLALSTGFADKRGLVVKLRDLHLVEEFAGSDGRLRFATTEAFLQRFGLASLGELTSVQFLGSPPSTHPLI